MMLVWKIIASGFGTGYVPAAPGTAGALAGCLGLTGLQAWLPGCFSGGWQQAPYLLLLITLFFLLGATASNKLEPAWGHDPSRVVVDEMVGLWVAMLGVPFSLFNLALAFGLFRLFDIWKPLGIRRMERLPGGWGVMMDDVVAGLYANVFVQITLLVHGN